AKLSDLKVISHNSVARYRGAHNTQEIGRALNVAYVLEGSVRRNAGRIFLNVQLVDTRTGTHVWTESYDRNSNDVFAMQTEVAQKVADRLGAAHDRMYFLGFDHTDVRLKLAETAIHSVRRLRPDSGDTHLTLGQHLYWAYQNYDRAREELTVAQRTLPNESRIPLMAGYIDRRQGHWEKSLEEIKQALELDPRNFSIRQQVSLTYQGLRRYKETAATLDDVLAITPKDVTSKVQRAWVDLQWRADPKPLHMTIETVLAQDPSAVPAIVIQWLELALSERDPVAAEHALAAI